jgi:hypothetical protein
MSEHKTDCCSSSKNDEKSSANSTSDKNQDQQGKSCCGKPMIFRFDHIFWFSLIICSVLYFSNFFTDQIDISWLTKLSSSVFELINTMWWGVLLGVFMVSILSKIPREFVTSILGKPGSKFGVFRATFAGFLLDLCSHGILMVGSKLYERGASAGQVVSFLVSSPWNSFSLTLVLISLIGLKWTLIYILLSFIIAIITGLAFDLLEKKKIIVQNKNSIDLPDDFSFFKNARQSLSETNFNTSFFKSMFLTGIKDSKMIIKWLLFGVVLASLIRLFLDPETFKDFFGPTLLGLGATLLFATILEVCSEGSAPIAADIFNRAGSPGNAFAFLMTGVSTDYTEIMVLKETTNSWKFAFFLPIITLPQIILLAYFINIS